MKPPLSPTKLPSEPASPHPLLIKVSLSVGSAELADALCDLLANLEPSPSAVSAFREAGTGAWLVDGLFTVAPDIDALADTCRTRLQANVGQFTIGPVPRANWVAVSQAALHPVAVGPFLVHGSHDRQRVHHSWRAIEIDAGEAFGTAHHASTRGCLIAIAWLSRIGSFRRILDLGCGSGILAFAAARALRGSEIIASDTDARAVTVARANARSNRLGHRIAFVVADGLSHRRLRRTEFDLLLANLVAEPLAKLAPAIANSVAWGGRVVLSGLLEGEAGKVAAAYAAAGFVRTGSVSLEGWTTLLLQRRPNRPRSYSQ